MTNPLVTNRTMGSTSPSVFLMQWIFLTTVGFAAGLTLALSAGWSMGEELQTALGQMGAALILGPLFGGLFGAMVGIPQTVVLAQYLDRAWTWAIASASGGAAAFALAMPALVGTGLADSLPGAIVGVTIGLVAGLGLGVAQGLALRRRVTGATWWPLISVVAMVMAMVPVFVPDSEDVWVLIMFGGGLLYSIVSGLGITRISAAPTEDMKPHVAG